MSVAMATKDIARVGVGLAGREMIPDAVTSMVGISPTRFHSKGEVVASRGVERVRPWSVWAVEFEATTVANAAAKLLEAVEPHKDALARAAALTGSELSVSIWWEPEGGQGGFTVSSDLMKRLSELGNRVDVYFPG
jgi:hypothetical protein